MVEKKQALAKLEELKAWIPALSKTPSAEHVSFLRWHPKVETAIQHIFPDDDKYLHRLKQISFEATPLALARDPNADERAFRAGLDKVDALLHVMIDHVTIYRSEGDLSPPTTSQEKAEAVTPAAVNDPRIVFVVHGRNMPIRDSMFNFLRAVGLKPLEWSVARAETREPNPYIGHILETAFSMAQAVVVVMTPDDEALLKKEFRETDDPPYETTLTGQARPNVLFEAGIAMGRDPKRTILVEIGTLRPFSDIAGRHTIKFDGSAPTRKELADRLRTAGCPVDLSGNDWLKTGSFALGKSSNGETEDEDGVESQAKDAKKKRPDLRLVLGPQRANSGPLMHEAKEVLQYLFHQRQASTVKQIRDEVFNPSMALHIVQEYCDELLRRGLISPEPVPPGTVSPMFSIAAKGRNFVINSDR